MVSLVNPDAEIRRKAIEFIGEMIDFAAKWQAPAIIGSMQGNVESDGSREQSLEWLAEGLEILGERGCRT